MMKAILAAALVLGTASLPSSAATVRDWRWLNGTTWYVPTNGLPAYMSHPGR